MKTEENKRDRISLTMFMLHIALLLCTVAVIVKALYIQYVFTPDPRIERALKPLNTRKRLEPVRGRILDRKGRILAISYPVYDLRMDCKVGEDSLFYREVPALAAALASKFGNNSAKQYGKRIIAGRKSGNGYLRIADGVEARDVEDIRQFPIFNRGRNKGGLIVEQRNVRRYPYGKLARRTIGFVRDNKAGTSNNHVGIEGKYDYILHGKDGYEWLKSIEKRQSVRNYDSLYVPAVDGSDVVLTIDIDYQEIADRELRKLIENEPDLMGATLTLMEVRTGAVRAMVNLVRSKSGKFEEEQNIAIGRRYEPGSIFKTVTLLSVLSDGFIHSLEETLPTNHGVVEGIRMSQDHHIVDYEREHHTSRISVLDGFKMSSNYVFATLALKNYSSNPKRFIDNIYSYKLGEAFDFDLNGLLTPTLPSPDNKWWSMADLGAAGYGYATEETTLHMLTFYNAIAGKGRMMKPYLLEDGHSAGILNASICPRAVADTMTRALRSVTEEGTAKWSFKNARCSVAGKTGTSFGTLPGHHYSDRKKIYQGTFAGYFPAENPQYSVICMIYSRPTEKSYQGGGIPARAICALINELYNIDPYWQKEL